MYNEKQSSFWWLRNEKSFIYFMRELTGVAIAAYMLYFLVRVYFKGLNWLLANRPEDFIIMSWIGLVAALFHTLTWMWVTITISPITLPKPVQYIAFVVAMAGCAAVSYGLYTFVYTTTLQSLPL